MNKLKNIFKNFLFLTFFGLSSCIHNVEKIPKVNFKPAKSFEDVIKETEAPNYECIVKNVLRENEFILPEKIYNEISPHSYATIIYRGKLEKYLEKIEENKKLNEEEKTHLRNVLSKAIRYSYGIFISENTLKLKLALTALKHERLHALLSNLKRENPISYIRLLESSQEMVSKFSQPCIDYLQKRWEMKHFPEELFFRYSSPQELFYVLNLLIEGDRFQLCDYSYKFGYDPKLEELYTLLISGTIEKNIEELLLEIDSTTYLIYKKLEQQIEKDLMEEIENSLNLCKKKKEKTRK